MIINRQGCTSCPLCATGHPLIKRCALVLLGLLLSSLAGCASTNSSYPNGSDNLAAGQGSGQEQTAPLQYGAYALEGPDLFVAGDLAGTPLRGTMQRKSMIGMGKLKLYAQDNAYICESVIKAPPTEKGRIRGILDCSDGTVILFTLRNIGPDQGLGIGTAHEDSKDLTIFYHPSAEEAERRFPEILQSFTELRQTKRS